jgi:hypothetical protein
LYTKLTAISRERIDKDKDFSAAKGSRLLTNFRTPPYCTRLQVQVFSCTIIFLPFVSKVLELASLAFNKPKLLHVMFMGLCNSCIV